MKKINSTITSLLLLLLLNACGSVAEGLSGSKKKGSDEFLVEKKAPLVLPPSFGELPKPGTQIDENIISKTKESTLSIEEMINKGSKKNINKENNNLEDSFEELIIRKINEQ